MGWRYWGAGKRALACLVFFAMGAAIGLLPGLQAKPAPSASAQSLPPASTESLSPADIVASRFQANAIPADSAASPPPAGGFALASVSEVPNTLDPVYSPLPQPAVAPAEVEVSAEPAVAVPAPTKRTAPSPRPPAASPNVLNNAQIASIRERLRLSSYQDQLWPPVESALRDINFRKDPKAKSPVKTAAAIDPDSTSVQRLKSAAVPLIMSFNDDQKQEVRTLLRLMGLENLATQF
jgi:hypothetical protein